jgi:ParB-like chromosome segregation protein Spo0J
MTAREVHPVADLFPMLADDELAELAADIQERGLLQPIVLDADGRVLDGRNRLAACELAGVQPRFMTYEGGDPDGYALAVNIARRHLTTGARAIITERARRLNDGPRWKTPKLVVANEAGLSPRRLEEAAVVLDWCDAATINEVLAGTKPLSRAVEVARRLKKEDADREAKKTSLREGAPDLLARVGEGLDLDDAMAALKAREDKARQEAEAQRTEENRRAAEAAAKAARISESLRMAVNTLIKGFGTAELRQQIADSYVPTDVGSEVNQNITAAELATAAAVCSDLANRWETP